MKLYYNKARGILGTAPSASTSIAKLTVKRMARVTLELVPVNASGTYEAFAGGASGLLAVKALHDFTGPLKVLDSAWDAPVEDGQGYVFEFTAGSVGIDAVLGTEAAKTFALEITIDMGDGKWLVLPTVELVIENNYYREDEVIPDDAIIPYPPADDVVTEAPEDGKLYVRKDGAWIEMPDPHVFGDWRMSVDDDGLPVFTKIS